MTTAEMLALLKLRTKVADESKLTLELKSAYRWAARRIFNAEGGPDLLLTLGEELTAFASNTKTFDLGAAVAGGFLGLKMLWVKLPGDTRFVPMDAVDATDLQDSAAIATPDVATGNPICYAVYNMDKLRFASTIPATSVLRVDYFKTGSPPDPTTNPTQENGTDLPDVFHDAICSKAIAQLFSDLDDDREGTWETRARDEITDAVFQATKRVQGPTRTKPFQARRRRSVNGL